MLKQRETSNSKEIENNTISMNLEKNELKKQIAGEKKKAKQSEELLKQYKE